MKRVLIIEDDPRIAAALEVRFNDAGFTSIIASDAAAGLSKAVQTQPDLILLDISLPAGDGLQLAKRLRGRPETASTPFIFVTASKDPALRAKAMDLSAAGLFEKPYNAEELMAVAWHALGQTSMLRRPDPEVATDHAETPLPRSEPGTKKILIVEDDHKIALALALRLQSSGYQTAVAHDALAGVSTAVKLCPDLVLLDVSIPAGTGFSVAERLRGLLPDSVPMIFLTASKQPGLRERALELGAAAYFEKPYEAEALLTAVRAQIGS